MNNKTTIKFLALAVASLFGISGAFGQSLGTTFTYQGRLADNGLPAEGTYSMEFRLFDAEFGGQQIANTIFSSVSAMDGLFTVALDFGPGAYNDNDNPGQRWLSVEVDNQVLSPRQPMNGSPYSLQTRGLRVREDGGGQTTSVGSQLSGFINGFQKFNVLVDDSEPYSGMAVQTESGGDPAYHYYSGNNLTARHYVDASESAWRLFMGDDRIFVDGNSGFVGINKDTQVAGNEMLGVYRATTAGAGIIIETDVFGDPYFGYATGGELRAYHAYDDDDDQWKVYTVDNGSASARLFMNSDGNLGLGFSQPALKLMVNGNAGKPGGGPWANVSDRRLKKNINGLDGALQRLLRLRGVTFEYKDPEAINELSGVRTGFIAQEAEKVFPDWVSDTSAGYKVMSPKGFEALAVEAFRELRAEKDKQIELLEDENDELRERLESLEAQMQDLLTSLSNH